MTLKQKFELTLKKHGLSKKNFAEKIDINIIVLNRSIKKGVLTGEIVKAIVCKMPSVDLQFLLKDDNPNEDENLLVLNEQSADYSKGNHLIIAEIEVLIAELKRNLSPK